jgi:carboxyl-terminal processing protease
MHLRPTRINRALLFTLFLFGFLCLTASFVQAQENAAAGAAIAPPEVDEAARAVIEKHLTAIGPQHKNQAPGKTTFIDTVTETERNGIVEKGRRVDEQKNAGDKSDKSDKRDKAPKRFYTLQDGASGKIETGFDGKRAWRRAAFFRGYLDDNDAVALAARQPRQELSNYRNNGMMLKKLDDETIDGKNYIVIASQVNTMGRMTPMKYYFDPDTYFVRRTEQGSGIKVATTMSDFRRVDGRMLPFVRTIQTPQTSLVTRTISVSYSETIDESIFEFGNDNTKSTATNTATTEKPAEANKQANEQANAQSRAADYVIDQKTKQSTFQVAWKTINDSYWDATFHGVDWNKVREKYAPLIESPHTNKSFHELMNVMVGELKRSHLRVVAPHQVSSVATTSAELGKNGAPGIDMRFIDGELVVIKIEDDAETANILNVGDVIDTINDKTPQQMLADYRNQSSGFVGREPSAMVRAARSVLAGAIDEKPTLAVRDANNVKRNVVLTRKKPNLLRQLDFESKRINDDIAYIRFNLFIGDLAQKFKEAIAAQQKTKGLIIDLRGNGGGIGDLSTALASMLSTEKGTLGESRFRYETRQFGYAGSAEAYTGKVIFLVDEFSGSTSEVLTGGLQYAKRIQVLGERTAGAVLPSLVTPLPSGGAMQYAISDFRLPDQRVLEGEGVMPNETIIPKRRDVIEGRDVVLARAIAMLSVAR